MKKTYITFTTLFVIITAIVLTYISNVDNNDNVYLNTTENTEVYMDVNSTTTATTNKQDITVKPIVLSKDKSWTWVKTVYNDGKIIESKDSNKFKLTFLDDKTFSVTTDCNGVGGEYKRVKDSLITFDKMMSTLMYCEGSQEQEFTKSLSEVASLHITDKGELVFDLKYDSGSMIFK